MTKHLVDVWQLPSVTLERYRCVPGAIEAVETHFHEEYQLCLSSSVACTYYSRGTTYVVPQGGLSIINSDVLHSTSDAQPRPPHTVYQMVYINPTVLHSIASEITGHRVDQPSFPELVINDQFLARQVLLLSQALANSVLRLEQDSLVLNILTHLLRFYAQSHSSKQNLSAARPEIQRVQRHLEANFTRNIPLEELAQLAQLSSFHLTRVFRCQTGLTMHTYLILARLAQAKTLLRRGLPLAQVASEVGFYDQSQFGFYFKRFVGTSPACYSKDSKNHLNIHQ